MKEEEKEDEKEEEKGDKKKIVKSCFLKFITYFTIINFK